jgi:hypothetical protein
MIGRTNQNDTNLGLVTGALAQGARYQTIGG